MIDIGKCCTCGAPMWLPDDLYHAAKCSPSIVFYCGYGHEQHFRQGPSEAETLRLERDRLKQQIAQKDDEIREAVSRAAREAARADTEAKRAERIKRRAIAGVCPCCNRTFSNVQRHMKSKHKNVVPLEKKTA